MDSIFCRLFSISIHDIYPVLCAEQTSYNYQYIDNAPGAVTGILWGCFWSIDSRDMSGTALLAMFVVASLLVSMVLSGVFWPIENIPYILQFCGQFTPNTLPIQSLRYILYREWTLDYYEVYMGFVVTYGWFAFFLIIALIVLQKSY